MFAVSRINIALLVTVLSTIHAATAQTACPSNTTSSVMVLSNNGTTLSGPLNCTSLAGKFDGDESISAAANYISYLRINDKATCMHDSCAANCTIQSTNPKADDSADKTMAEKDVQSFCTDLGGRFVGGMAA